ncbi:hypothetical protein BDN72DRAFT_155995 [Pluteus cervinus]|uniref:Uncharacterized protein n=1 Tax=Pluteus cervinus TaxID=181527 RepID=A0ACD3ALQ2_9AGAR|nr:hypothetical protein BDN72DRAFT_155995 [Pluteus cervinus]
MSCAPPNVNLGPYSGVELLCTFAAMALWGIACMQTFLYFFKHQSDPLPLRLLVSYLWIMDTVHQCLIVSGSYKANVSGQVYVINNVRPEYVIQMLITSLVSAPAQGFFAYRIWTFTKRGWVVPVIVIPAIAFQLVDGILLVRYNLDARLASQVTSSKSRTLLITSFATSAIVDLFLSIGLCIALWRTYMRGGTALRRTTHMVYRVTLFSINTGSWTALVALLTIMSVVVYPGNFIYVGLYFLLSPMYCNSILASLNARSYLRGDLSKPIEMSGIRHTLTEKPTPPRIDTEARASTSVESVSPGTTVVSSRRLSELLDKDLCTSPV